MTLLLPKKSLGDRVLKMLGRKRAVYCRVNYAVYGAYAYCEARKEALLVALLPRRDRKLKPGWYFLDDMETRACTGKGTGS